MVIRSSPQAKERVGSCEIVVHEMSRGIAPQANRGMLAVCYSGILDCARCFFVHQANDEDGVVITMLGNLGLGKFVSELWAKSRASQDVSMNDIESIRPFWWLLGGEQRMRVRT